MELPTRRADKRASAAPRDFRLVCGANTVSALGTAVTTIALPLVAVIVLKATIFQVGLVSASGMVGWIFFGLSAGVWVDRMRRRPVLITCDVVRAAALISVPIAAALSLLTLVHLMIVALVVSVASVFFDIASQTYLPAIVNEETLLASNSKLQASQSAAEMGGPALGGALVSTIGAPFAVVVDAVSFVISAVCLGRVRTREDPIIQSSMQPAMFPQIREGLAYTWRHPVLRPLMLTAAGVNMLSAGTETLLVVFLLRTVDITPGLIGVLLASSGLGGVLGASIASKLSDYLGSARTIVVAAIACPLLSLLVPITFGGIGLAFFVAGSVGATAFMVVFSVVARYYRQTETPAGMLGRVTATVRFVSWGVLPFGALAAGALGDLVGLRSALWILSLGLLLTPLPILTSPLSRRATLAGSETIN